MSASITPCFGSCCECRSRCAAYHSLESVNSDRVRIYFCPKRADGTRTGFVPLWPMVTVRPIPAIERRAAA
jgi:hypothetical protein